MYIDFHETMMQIRALVRICYFKPNGWREIVIGMIALVFAPLVILICLLSNSKQK